jgi:hypothetical protein
MPTYGKLTAYGDSEDWTQYIERLESYFDANKITDADKQRNILLSVMEHLIPSMTKEEPSTGTKPDIISCNYLSQIQSYDLKLGQMVPNN